MSRQSRANRPPRPKCPKCGAAADLSPAPVLDTSLCSKCWGAYARACRVALATHPTALREAFDGVEMTEGRKLQGFLRKIRTLAGWAAL